MKAPEDATAPTEQILTVPRSQIAPSPLNPRKSFPDEYLSELGLNLRNNGQINALVVREIEYQIAEPATTNSWQVSWRTVSPDGPWQPLSYLVSQPEEMVTGLLLTREACEARILDLPRYELVAGECRWRASAERPHPELSGIVMAAISHLNIVVRELSDAVVLELMLSENMKRRDLAPLEEMDAFSRMLAQRGPDGEALHTQETLAAKIGVSQGYVGQRLLLRKLTVAGREALARDRISFFTARTICSCPATVVPLVEDQVLNPKKYDRWHQSNEPLTADETQELIHEKYVRKLSDAPFPLNDPHLVPIHTNESGERVEGGACTDCPWNTANQQEEAAANAKPRGRGERGEAKACLNPTCYQKKVDVHVAAELVKAKEQGCTILSDKEAERAIHENGALTYNSEFVKLDEKPDHGDRANNVEEKKLPKWSKIVTGPAAPPVVIAVDRRGHVHRLVERKLAVAAARKNDTDKYLSLGSGRGRSSQSADYDEQRKKEAEKAKLRGLQSRAILAELEMQFRHRGIAEGFWPALLPLAVRHAGHAGCTLVAKRREIETAAARTGGAPSAGDKCEKFGAKLEGADLSAFCFELLLAQDFAYCEGPHSSDVVPTSAKALLKLYDVDPGAIKKRVETEAAAKKRAKVRPPAKATNPKAAAPAGENSPAPKAEAPLSPEIEGQLARIAAMAAEGIEITIAKVQSALKLRGVRHAEWLVNRWKKQQPKAARS